MVNEDFKREVKQLFLKGFEDALVPGTDPSRWTFKEKTSLDSLKEDEFFVLTVSSQLFRVIMLIHFTRNARTEALAAEILKVGANNMDASKFYDYLGEVGNAFCGALKRELNKTVPSLGMSTPNRLSKDCLKYMSTLNSDYDCHAVAEYDDSALFYASVYICADEQLNYEVKSGQQSEDEVDSGELEFF